MEFTSKPYRSSSRSDPNVKTIGWTWNGILHSFYPHDVANFFRHNTYTKACLSSQPVFPSSRVIPQLVDHRYFFDEFHEDQRVNMGYNACGIARDAVATELLANKVNFNQVNSNLWALYVQAKQRQQIQRAPEPPTRGGGQGGIEKQGVSGLGEQMRLDGPSAAAGPSGGEARRSRGSGGSRSGGRGGIRSDDRKVYQSRTVAELRLELKSRVLLQAGKKEELINRLMEHDRTRGTSRQ